MYTCSKKELGAVRCTGDWGHRLFLEVAVCNAHECGLVGRVAFVVRAACCMNLQWLYGVLLLLSITGTNVN